MSLWQNLARARHFSHGIRYEEISALLTYRRLVSDRPDIVVASPKRFLSLHKLLKKNNAINDMLRVMHTTFSEAQARGLSFDLRLSEETIPTNIAPKLWLSHHTIQTAAFDALTDRGTMVRHFKAADIPHHTVIDPKGFAGWSTLADTDIRDLKLPGVSQDQIKTFFTESRDRMMSGNVSKYTQTNAKTQLPEIYVFIALQTIGDMVQRNAYIPMLDMLHMIVAFFRDSGVQVVVKRHPKCRSRRVTRALKQADLESHVTITTGSIHDILKGAAALFTVNSGVGAESIIHKTPIYCFGKADYAPVAHQIRSYEDLARTAAPLRPACSEEELHRFLYHYRNIFQIEHGRTLAPRLGALIDAAMS